MLKNSRCATVLATALLLTINLAVACTPGVDCVTGFNPESQEYFVDFTHNQPINQVLDEFGTPTDAEPHGYSAFGYEYKITYEGTAPQANILNESAAPTDAEPNTYSAFSHEYKIDYSSTAPQNNVLDESVAPTDAEPNTYSAFGYEYKIDFGEETPSNNVLDETSAPQDVQPLGYKYMGAEYSFDLKATSPTSIKKFEIRNSSDQPIKNAEIDLKLNNEIESSYLTNESGQALVEFRDWSEEYAMDIFHPLYGSNNIAIVPEEYSAGILNDTPLPITLPNRSGKWANEHWEYGIPFSITPEANTKDWIVKVALDFQGTMYAIDSSKFFDIHSVRLVEVDSNENITSEKPSEVS